jgi:multidrug resistance efflux pump
MLGNNANFQASRRSFVFGILAASASTVLPDTIEDKKSNKGFMPENFTKLLVCCPKDGMVNELLIKDGGAIELGQLICTVDPDDENRTLDRIAAMEQLTNIEAKQLEETVINYRLRQLEINYEIANAYVLFAEKKLDLVSGLYSTTGGFIDNMVPVQADAAHKKALGEREKAVKQIELFKFSVSQSEERMKVLKAELEKEKLFVKKRLERLKIASPGAGKVNLLVGVKSFIKMGDPLAELIIEHK